MQTGDTTADISRMFIYYVGRKKDQMSFHEVGAGAVYSGRPLP